MMIAYPRTIACVAAAAMLLSPHRGFGAPADDSEGNVIGVGIVGGVPVVRGQIHTASGATVEANFVLDLGSNDGFVLPPDRLRELGLDAASTVEVTLDGRHLKDVHVVEQDRAELVRSLTTDHAAELKQVPAIGLLGLGAFGSRTLQLDLSGNALRPDASLPAPPLTDRTTVLPLADGQGGPFFALEDARAGIGTIQFESRARAGFIEDSGLTHATTRPTITLGGVDLMTADAYRTSSLDGRDLELGVRFLSHYRVTIDRSAKSIAFEQLTKPTAPLSEQRFFTATREGDADGIANFLSTAPDSRLANEAAMRLLELRINAGDSTAIAGAIDALAASFPVPRRAHRMTLVADQLLDRPDGAKFDSVVRLILDVATRTAASDLNNQAIHEIHARQGLLALRMGDLAAARRSLISAAYGMPADPHVNEWLGDLYRRQRQPLRAWARYVEASLGDAPAPGALKGLDALTRDDRYRAAVTPTDVALMLEGRVPSFVAPRSNGSNTTASARLVELFVNDGAPGCVAAQLAFESLRATMPDGPTAFVAYHLGPAGNSSVASAAAHRNGVTTLPTILVDGEVLKGVMAAGQDGAGNIYDELVNRVYRPASATMPTDRPLTLSAHWEGDRLSVTVAHAADGRVADASADPQLFVLLVEHNVFAIGGNGLAIHDATARGIIGAPDGQSFNLATGRLDLSIEEADIRQANSIDGERDRLRNALAVPSMQTTEVRLEACDLIAVLQDATTKRIYAVATTRPTGKAGS